MAKKILYSEPADYFPKSVRDKIEKEAAKDKKKAAPKKTTAKKKVKRK